MGKVLWIEDDEGFDESHPGCISGMFHALDYHYWHSNVKKILPHRKHQELLKHVKRNRRYQRISDDQDTLEVLKLLDDHDAKTSHIQMDQRNQKTSSTRKRSLKARIKALVSEDNYEDSTPKLQRTYSIHHLESNEWVQPVAFFPEYITESPVSSKHQVDVTHPEVNDSQDILDMFEVDKELFINTVQDRSAIRPQLTKSGSFPSAYRTLMPMKLTDKVNEIYTVSKGGKIKNSNEDVNNNDIIRFRRISSLHESADRYAQLFDFSISKEAALRSSRSLKLTNGSESMLSLQETSSFKRSNSRQESQECKPLNEMIDKNDDISENEDSPKAESVAFGEDSHGLKIKEEDDHRVLQETAQQSQVLAHEYCPPDEEVQILEGNFVKKIDLSMKDDDFTYVKKILERSGFLKNGFQQTWYTSSQPLDPFVFQELESQYFHDPERFAEEVKELSHHLLIFDLVDEVLLTMHERSFTYYPKKLSSFLRPAPTGTLVLDEVWDRVSRLINFKHDVNESLNDIVSRDLRSDDGWMSLEFDLECVGVDVEEWILDDVLEELLFELI